jgi:oxygen-independent coproporphyrinogen-3 oxidase
MQGLYIHVPFCGKVCNYCDFAVLAAPPRLYEEYVNLLLQEATVRIKRDPAFVAGLTTLYLGGGTPSILPPALMHRLLKGLSDLGVPFAHLDEFTMEVNPESAFPERLETVMQFGASRLSLGLQSLDAFLLGKIGRAHTVEMGLEALERLIALSFRGIRISADLMFQLPLQTVENFISDVRFLALSGVGHISFYGLNVAPNTVLGTHVRKGLLELPEALYRDMYNGGVTVLEAAGFHRYEVSNFAKSGEESIHNQNYWNRGEYWGLGPGAHSFQNQVRFAGPSAYARWRSWVQDGCPDRLVEKDLIHKKERIIETIWLSLRQESGLDLDALQKNENVTISPGTLEALLQKKWIRIHSNRVSLAGDGWIMMDSAVQALIPHNIPS